MDSGVKVTLDATGEFVKAIKALGRNVVMVGVPSTTATRQPEPGEMVVLNNAQIAYIHEHGAPEANIPARPFLAPTINAEAANIHKRLTRAGERAFDGEDPMVEMHRLGAEVVSAIRRKITEGPFIPLSPVTLRQRLARGRTGDKPLIDTGQLRRSINYVIRKRTG